MAIKVSLNRNPTIKVRVGQAQATKLVTSSSLTSGNLSSINDIDTGARGLTSSGTFSGDISANSILMYNTDTGNYQHVSPYDIVDFADASQDNSMDGGTF